MTQFKAGSDPFLTVFGHQKLYVVRMKQMLLDQPSGSGVRKCLLFVLHANAVRKAFRRRSAQVLLPVPFSPRGSVFYVQQTALSAVH